KTGLALPVVVRPTRLGLDSSARKLMPADSPLVVVSAAVVGSRQTVVVVPGVRVPHDLPPRQGWCVVRRCARRSGSVTCPRQPLVVLRLLEGYLRGLLPDDRKQCSSTRSCQRPATRLFVYRVAGVIHQH